MSSPCVVVLDYGSGNVHSVAKALEVAGANVELTRDRDAVLNADGLIVPGVGAFTAVMDQLNSVKGGELIDKRLVAGKPVMGICVGLQVMFEHGVEHGIETDGLGQWRGTVELLDAPLVPHIGWNTVTPPADSTLFEGIADERFYFVHSYHLACEDAADVCATADYGERFPACVQRGRLYATQFHPEKSHRFGLALMKNFVEKG